MNTDKIALKIASGRRVKKWVRFAKIIGLDKDKGSYVFMPVDTQKIFESVKKQRIAWSKGDNAWKNPRADNYFSEMAYLYGIPYKRLRDCVGCLVDYSSTPYWKKEELRKLPMKVAIKIVQNRRAELREIHKRKPKVRRVN